MEIRDQQVGVRHKYRNSIEQFLTSWKNTVQQYNEQDRLSIDRNLLDIIAERDAAIKEKNQALLEKKKAFEERRVAIAQRNLAIKECNDAVLEKNNAVITLQHAMISDPVDFRVQDPTKRPTCSPGNQAQSSSRYVKSEEVDIVDALCKTMVASECPTVRSPRKPKHIGEDMKRMVLPNTMKVNKVFNTQNPGLNKINFDETIMPIPGCSCTGTFRRCYKWASGGWQSSCCTNTISAFPLPRVPHKRCGRICGRKMTGSVFSRLLGRLAVEGFDFSRPVDLKEHWSKHGTNRYITIK